MKIIQEDTYPGPLKCVGHIHQFEVVLQALVIIQNIHPLCVW